MTTHTRRLSFIGGIKKFEMLPGGHSVTRSATIEQKVFPVLGIGSDGIDLLNNVVNFQLICFEHILGISPGVRCMRGDLPGIDQSTADLIQSCFCGLHQ